MASKNEVWRKKINYKKIKSIDNFDYSINLEDKNKLEKTFSKLESRLICKLGTEKSDILY